MKKRYFLAPVLVTGIIIGGITLRESKANKTPELANLIQQVKRHDEQIDNHEVRIQNLQNNVEKVQIKTQTSSSHKNIKPPKVKTPIPDNSCQYPTRPLANGECDNSDPCDPTTIKDPELRGDCAN